MEKKGKFIVIESNNDWVKGAVVDELERRLKSSTMIFSRMETFNQVVGYIEKNLEGTFGVDFPHEGATLEWTTSFLISEAVLLETISLFSKFGLGKIVSSGKNVIIDHFDATLYVKTVPPDRALNVIFNTVNDKVVSMLPPDIRILIASKDLGGTRYSQINRSFDAYTKIYRNIERRGNAVKIISDDDKTINEICDEIEVIINRLTRR